jgi:hypothetical protein
MKDKTLCRRCQVLSKKMNKQERIIRYITEDDSDKSHLKYLVQENVRLYSIINNSENMLFYKAENKIRRMIYLIKAYIYKLFYFLREGDGYKK